MLTEEQWRDCILMGGLSVENDEEDLYPQVIECPTTAMEIQSRLYRKFAHATPEDLEDMSEADRADWLQYLDMEEHEELNWLKDLEKAIEDNPIVELSF